MTESSDQIEQWTWISNEDQPLLQQSQTMIVENLFPHIKLEPVFVQGPKFSSEVVAAIDANVDRCLAVVDGNMKANPDDLKYGLAFLEALENAGLPTTQMVGWADQPIGGAFRNTLSAKGIPFIPKPSRSALVEPVFAKLFSGS